MMPSDGKCCSPNIHTPAHARTHTHTHTYAFRRTHTHKHTQAHTRTHARTHSREHRHVPNVLITDMQCKLLNCHEQNHFNLSLVRHQASSLFIWYDFSEIKDPIIQQKVFGEYCYSEFHAL